MANERQQTIYIPYGGMTAVPSDYDSPDGDLALCAGALREDGALRAVLPPKRLWRPVAATPDGGELVQTVVFLHKNNGWTHYVLMHEEGGSLCYSWADASEIPSARGGKAFTDKATGAALQFTGEKHAGVTAIGNTLVVSTDKHIHYFLFGQDGSGGMDYRYLGTKVPAIQMEFGLKGELVGKYFDDLGLTLSEDDVAADGAWNIVKNESVTLGGTYSAAQVRVTLTKGKTYGIRLGEPNSGTYQPQQWKWTIYYVTSDGTKYLADMDTLREERQTVTPTMDFTCIELSSPSLSVHQQTIVIEEYTEGAALGKGIKYDSDNYTAVMGVVNAFVNQYATEKNRHIYPFFVRYAVRLYDERYIHISPPVLLIPNSGYAPYMVYSDVGKMEAFAFIADLQARVADVSAAFYDDWQDIVSGVDLFCSQPVYPYKQGKEFSKYETLMFCGRKTDSVGYLEASYSGMDITPSNKRRIGLVESAVKWAELPGTMWRIDGVQIAPLEEKEILTKIRSVSAFHLMKRYSSEDLRKMGGEFSKVEPEEGTLSNLAARTPLDDEQMAVRTMATGTPYSYNKRLHLFGASYELPAPYPMQRTNQQVFTGESGTRVTGAWVLLHTDDGDKCVHAPLSIAHADDTGMVWYFYPDNRAYELRMGVEVFDEDGITEHYVSKPLTRHDTLNGAYWLADTLDVHDVTYLGGDPPPAADSTVRALTNIYVSEVNNPFSFRSGSTVTIGATRVMGLCTAAKAMSTGQFGQFPLYAFTDNGVWALELTSTGTYRATQPVTRDVCVNADSITQLDGEVAFATSRGLMLLSGSTSTCLSAALDGKAASVVPSVLTRPQCAALLGVGADALPASSLATPTPDAGFLSGCRCVYDYTGQRLMAYNPSYGYCYVYGIKDGAWCVADCGLRLGVNSYPDALATDGGGWLVDVSESDADSVRSLVVTRPLQLGARDTHKTVDTVIQRGGVDRSAFRQVLLGSDDLRRWRVVWSSADGYLRGSSGTPYKYFRVAMCAVLGRGDSASGLTVRFEGRLGNRPR